jgi:hypothetical protein
MKKAKKRRKITFFKDGVPSLLGLSLLFLTGGIIAITDPIPFTSVGGTGRYGGNNATTTYSNSETQVWGVIFLAIGLFFLFCTYCRQRYHKR